MAWCQWALPMSCALLVACASQAPPLPTESGLPAHYQQAPEKRTSTLAIDSRWWQDFGSGELTGLIEQAREQSLDIAAAVARVHQAQAVASAAGAALLPALNASMSANRQGDIGGHRDSAGTVYGAGLNASYEVDFWGRNRALRDGARAEWQASRFNRDTVRLTTAAGTARLWLQAVALRERVHLAQQNLDSAERLLALVLARHRAGAATPLELAQQRGLAANQRRALSALRQQTEDARIALNRLLGLADGIHVHATSLSGLTAPAITPGIPSDLLVRRPDIASAEARLRAADANVAAARAALLPSIALTGGISVSHDQVKGLFDDPVYAVIAGLSAPILNGGRLSARHALAQARREELLVNYHQNIVSAFADVESALNAIAGLDDQARAQAEQLVQAKTALELAEARYKAGADSLLTLLDAQRTLYDAQDTAVQIHRAHLQAIVSLYQALGGGWSGGASQNT